MVRSIRSCQRLVTAAISCLVLALLPACGDRGYSQKTPDDVLRTAKLMVDRGEARKLSYLFYADNPDMKKVVGNLGVLMGNLQRLGSAVTESFPNDVDRLKTSAEAAAKSGKGGTLFSQIISQVGPTRQRRAPRDSEKARKDAAQREKDFGDALNMLFADPYGFLNDSAGKITTTVISEDMAAIMWDGKPVLPPLGMVMRKDAADGKWYIVLPLNIPGLANYLPQSAQEYKVFGAFIAIINNVIVDLARDVREKRITTMSDLSRKAGEKAFLPAAMGFVAYSKMIEERTKKRPATTAPTVPGGASTPATPALPATKSPAPTTPR